MSRTTTAVVATCGVPTFTVGTKRLLRFRSSILARHALLITVSRSNRDCRIVRLLGRLNRQRRSQLAIIKIAGRSKDSLTTVTALDLLYGTKERRVASAGAFVAACLMICLLTKTLSNHEISGTLLSDIIQRINLRLRGKKVCLSHSITFLDKRPFIRIVNENAIFTDTTRATLVFVRTAGAPTSTLLNNRFHRNPLRVMNPNFVYVVCTRSQSNICQRDVELVTSILSFGNGIVLISSVSSNVRDIGLLRVGIRYKSPSLFTVPSVIPIRLVIGT